jgi:CheY-like chemotaxis protein
MKILLVEDNEMNRDMLSRRLLRRGHLVVTAVDGRAAVDTALAEQPDVVLMDMGLPVMDGWEAARRIKSDARTTLIPIIALTAHAMAEDRARALAAGCDDFDTKPVDLERLCGKIAAVTRDPHADIIDRGVPDAVLRVREMVDLDSLAAFVDRTCATVNASGDATADVRLAIEEVFTNILQHGYGGRSGPVTVHIKATPEQITVTVTDDAPAFDPGCVQTPDLASSWEERRLGGLGWHLVHQVMDEVNREPGLRGGNVFTLVKKLSAPPHGT